MQRIAHLSDIHSILHNLCTTYNRNETTIKANIIPHLTRIPHNINDHNTAQFKIMLTLKLNQLSISICI
jgi:hypothetical protein